MDLQQLSKLMSLILRHKPETIGITLDEHGWADVQALVNGINKKYVFDQEMLEEIVRTDSKGRYAFNETHTKIRANQGHSIQVDVELEVKTPPEYLWHGTGRKYVDAIEQMGLIPKSRLYVHLSGDIDTAEKVGARHGELVIYRVMSGNMARAGYTFYLSKNGVWLTKKVPTQFLEKQTKY